MHGLEDEFLSVHRAVSLSTFAILGRFMRARDTHYVSFSTLSSIILLNPKRVPSLFPLVRFLHTFFRLRQNDVGPVLVSRYEEGNYD